MELDEIEGEEDMEEEEEPQETDEFLGKEEEEEEEELEEEEMDEEVTSEESSASSPEWSETEAKESPEIAVVSDEEDEDGGSFEDIEFRSSSESEGTTSVLKVTKWSKFSPIIYSRSVYPNGYAKCAWSLINNNTLRAVSFFIYCSFFSFSLFCIILTEVRSRRISGTKTQLLVVQITKCFSLKILST